MTGTEVSIMCLTAAIFGGIIGWLVGSFRIPTEALVTEPNMFDAVEKNEDGTFARRSGQAAQLMVGTFLRRMESLRPDQDAFGPHAPEFQMPYQGRVLVAALEEILDRQATIDAMYAERRGLRS